MVPIELGRAVQYQQALDRLTLLSYDFDDEAYKKALQQFRKEFAEVISELEKYKQDAR